MITKIRELWEAIGLRNERGREARVHHWHLGKIEASGCSSGHITVVVDRKVAVTICVGARGSNVRGVKNVGVDEVELGNVNIPPRKHQGQA